MREYMSHAIVIALSTAFLWVLSLIVIHERVFVQEPNTVILILEIVLLLGFIIFSTVSIVKLVRRR